MKIIVLHGDNTLESYKRLLAFIKEARSRGWEVKRITNTSIDIPEALISDSLFSTNRIVVVEGVSLITKKVISWIKKKGKSINTTFVIYHPGVINKTFTKSLPKIDKTEEFSIPKLIWSFLGSFYPENAKNTLLLLHEIVKTEALEFVFSLLAKQVRDLYWVKVDPESMPYPSWRTGKLRQQSQKFSESLLTQIIDELADADTKSKTTDSNLLDLLDFIIVDKLK